MNNLFENPFILLILIGIISSIYKRMKNNEPEEKKRRTPLPHRVPSSSPGPVGQNKLSRDRSGQNKPVRHQNDGQTPTANQNEHINQGEQINRQTNRIGADIHRGPNENTAMLMSSVESSEPKLGKIDQSGLIDGLIWSEVLGPPRAKKPHRSIKHR